jgi:hypothetical protein
MKLMVAGCSFSAPSHIHPGTSWSEHLARKLGNWELVNLARQGCSNGGIRIQIDEIRRQRPDFAVIGPTFWDRMEIPADSAPYDWNQPLSSGENPPLERHLQNRSLGNGYRREDGIRNVNYGREPSNMICETIFTLAENFKHPYRMGKITKQAQQGVRHWIDSIYDNAWKKQMDEWMIREGIIMTYLDGIKFIVMPNLLWPFDPANTDQWRQAFPAIIPDHYIQLDPQRTPQVATGTHPFTGDDPGYHGSEASQILMADWLLEQMRQHQIPGLA